MVFLVWEAMRTGHVHRHDESNRLNTHWPRSGSQRLLSNRTLRAAAVVTLLLFCGACEPLILLPTPGLPSPSLLVPEPLPRPPRN